MKQKFYNGVLLVAMLFATMGSFVSCKDYDEDAYAELQGQLIDQNSTLLEALESQKQSMQAQIDALRQAQEACQTNCQLWQQQMEIWKTQIENWQKEINEWKSQLDNHYVTREEYNAKVAELEGKISSLTNQMIACTEDIANLKARDVQLDSAINAVDANLKDLIKQEDDKIWDALRALESSVATTVYVDSLANSIVNQIQDLKTDLQNAIDTNTAMLADSIGDVKTELVALISDLEQRVAANETAIESLNSTVTNLRTSIVGIEVLLNETVLAVEKAQALAEADSIRIDALVSEFETLSETLGELKQQHKEDVDSICDELSSIKDSVDAVAALARENLVLANNYTDNRIEVLRTEMLDSVAGLNVKIGALEAAYKEADAKLQEQIDDLADRLDDLEPRVEANEKAIETISEKIAELADRVDKVEESMKQFITGIILQGTENPVFGSFALPFNIKSNVLMAYYGYAGSYGIEFPTKYPRYYVNDAEVLSEKDLEMLGVASERLAEDGEAIVSGAGKVYVTVNPSSVNFEGQTLPIVNSIEEESGIKLSPLQYSDKKLTFGYSRSEENGLYEAEATLATEDIEKVSMKFDFDAADIKATVKDILNPTDGVNVTNVANTMVDVLNQFNQKLDANALKASWTDSLGVKRNVYSEYNIAATAIKPLSYSFLKDYKVSSLPGIERAESFINKVADKVKVNLPDFNLNIEVPTIKKIEIVELSDELLAEFKFLIDMDTTITIPVDTIKIDAYDKNGNKVDVKPVVVGGQSVEIWVTEVIDMRDEVEDFYAEIEKPIEDVNQILEDLEAFMDDVNDLLDEINKLNDFIVDIETGVNKVQDKLISYLNKFNNKMCDLINSANKVLQPTLLVKSEGSFAKLSQSLNYPSKINGTDFTLVPTSYTAEIIAPAYKKLVGVTNVYSMDYTKNAQVNGGEYLTALKDANAKEGVAEILEGDTNLVNFSIKPGYIYEVTYTSVDFSGMVAAKKFYVTVK